MGPRELESFHVEGSGYWKGYWVDPFGSTGRMTESYWYSTAAKSIVKFEGKSFHYTAGHRNTTYELRYELLDFHTK